jgi:hypothetical protein
LEANLATDPNPKHQDARIAELTVTAKFKREALAGLDSIIKKIELSYDHEGPGKFYMWDKYPHSSPVPNARTILLGHLCNWGGLLIILGGFIVVFNDWRAANLPKAATWAQGMAEIFKSEVEVQRHRFSSDTTKVKNLASVKYRFTAGSKTYEGDTISIGFAPADQVNETLERYPVGAKVPVFYNPADPSECVLGRDPPVNIGLI